LVCGCADWLAVGLVKDIDGEEYGLALLLSETSTCHY